MQSVKCRTSWFREPVVSRKYNNKNDQIITLRLNLIQFSAQPTNNSKVINSYSYSLQLTMHSKRYKPAVPAWHYPTVSENILRVFLNLCHQHFSCKDHWNHSLQLCVKQDFCDHLYGYKKLGPGSIRWLGHCLLARPGQVWLVSGWVTPR
jgi:hypothetical protein